MKIIWFNMKRNLHGLYNIILFWIPIIAIIIYALVFKISQEASDDAKIVFADCRVGIVDCDDSEMSHQIIDYLKDKYSISVLSEKQANQNLIKNKVNYVVIFPKGMSKDIHDSNSDVKIKTMSLTGGAMFIFFEEDLNYCINKYTIAGRVTDTDNDFDAFLTHLKKNSVKLNISTPIKDTEGIGKGQYTFWGFVIFFMIYYNCYFGNKFFEDKKNNIVNRVSNTKYDYGHYIYSLILGSMLTNILQILVISIILGLIIKLNSFQVTVGIGLVLFLAGLIGLALGIFISTVSKSKSMFLALVNIIINVLAMLGGLYWPITYMPDYMVLVAKFTPTYWLKEAMDNVLDMITVFNNYNLYIVLIFGVVIFFVTLLYHKYNFYKE